MANVNIGSLLAQIKVDTSSLIGASTSVNRFAASSSNSLRSITRDVYALQFAFSVLTGGIGIRKIMKEFSDYETALVNMGKVSSIPFTQLDKTIRGLNPTLGSNISLMKALYETMSAGIYDVNKAMELVIVASKGARAAHMDESETILGLTKFMAGYAGEVKTAIEASDRLFMIEKMGQAKFAELIPVIGGVASISKLAGINVNEMSAALSNITQFAPSVREAATWYTGILGAFTKPSELTSLFLNTIMVDAGKGTFTNSADYFKAMGGFEAGVKALAQTAENSGVPLGKLFFRLQAVKGIVPLLATDFELFNRYLKEGGQYAGFTANANERWLKSLEGEWISTKNVVSNLMVDIGEQWSLIAATTLTKFRDFFVDNRSMIIESAKVIGVVFIHVFTSIANVVDSLNISIRQLQLLLDFDKATGIGATFTGALKGYKVAMDEITAERAAVLRSGKPATEEMQKSWSGERVARTMLMYAGESVVNREDKKAKSKEYVNLMIDEEIGNLKTDIVKRTTLAQDMVSELVGKVAVLEQRWHGVVGLTEALRNEYIMKDFDILQGMQLVVEKGAVAFAPIDFEKESRKLSVWGTGADTSNFSALKQKMGKNSYYAMLMQANMMNTKLTPGSITSDEELKEISRRVMGGEFLNPGEEPNYSTEVEVDANKKMRLQIEKQFARFSEDTKAQGKFALRRETAKQNLQETEALWKWIKPTAVTAPYYNELIKARTAYTLENRAITREEKLDEIGQAKQRAEMLHKLRSEELDVVNDTYGKEIEEAQFFADTTRLTFKLTAEERVRLDNWVAEVTRLNQNTWLSGAQQGLQEYARTTMDIHKQVADVVTHAFQGMEDALTKFVMTGKGGFKELANSILEDMTRIAIQKGITGPLAEMLFGGGDAGGGKGALVQWLGSGGGALGKWLGSSDVVAQAGGGWITEPILGFGRSGQRYTFGENGAERVTPEANLYGGSGGGGTTVLNVNISAVDAASFSDMTRRNPGAIVGPLVDALRAGNVGMRTTMREALR